jgi:hypothetical protein
MQDTGNQGAEMEARVAVNFLANRLTELAGRLGLGSELGNALHKAAGILSKAVPRGSIPEGAEVAQMQRMALQQRQNAAALAAMRQQAGGSAPGGAPGGMPTPPPTPRPPAVSSGMAA